MKDMTKFMRIAMAQLRSAYPFRPQRSAVAARMYVEWLKRNSNEAVKSFYESCKYKDDEVIVMAKWLK